MRPHTRTEFTVSASTAVIYKQCRCQLPTASVLNHQNWTLSRPMSRYTWAGSSYRVCPWLCTTHGSIRQLPRGAQSVDTIGCGSPCPTATHNKRIVHQLHETHVVLKNACTCMMTDQIRGCQVSEVDSAQSIRYVVGQRTSEAALPPPTLGMRRER